MKPFLRINLRGSRGSIGSGLALFLSALLTARTGFGATLTVKPGGGGNATTINQALELLDYNDGQNDLVLIDPGSYDEQITAKGNAGVDSTAFPPVIQLTTAALEMTFSSHPDFLELRGADPNDPPVLTVIDASPTAYGFITHDTNKYFYAGLVHAGNNVTFANLNIRHGTGTTYGINGMAKEIVYRDCLFSNGQTEDASHSFFWKYQSFSRNTSYFNTTIAADNEYLVENSVVDGRSVVDGSIYDIDFVFFPNYGDEPLDFSASQPQGGAVISGCVVKNWGNSVFFWRGRIGTGTGLAHTLVEDSFFFNINDGAVVLRGNQGPAVVNRNVFTNSVATQGNPMIQIGEKDGIVPSPVTVSNNLFYRTEGVSIASTGSPGGSRPEHQHRILNNTFHSFPHAVQILGASEGSALIANNIFQGHPTLMIGTALVIDPTTGVEVNSTNNLFFNTLAVSGLPFGSMTGPIVGNPLFLTTTVTEPSPAGAPTLQGFVPDPSFSPAINAGDAAAFNVVSASAGNVDVDGSTRILDGVIDIGAQEIAFVPPPTHTPTFTPSKTPTRTPTPTATRTATRTNTPTITATRTPTRTQTPSNTPSPSNTPLPTISTTPTETPTSTLGSTATPTETGTPIATHTPCPGLVLSEICDFTGEGDIDASDLILLYDHVRSGSGQAEDLNCDGLFNYFDLFRFSQKWHEILAR